MAKTVEEKLKGVIKSVKPFMTDNVHQTWEGPKGILYKFWYVILCDGKEVSSTVLHKTNVSPFKDGMKIIFDKTTEDGKIKINNIKKADETGNAPAFKSTYNDPTSICGASFTQCLNLASDYIILRGVKLKGIEELESLAYKFHTWMMSDQETPNKDLIYQRRSVLEAAMKQVNILEDKTLGPAASQVLAWADQLWQSVDTVKGECGEPTP